MYEYASLHNSVHNHLLLGSDNSNTNDPNNSNSGSSGESGINYAYKITKNHKKHTIIRIYQYREMLLL